MATWSREAARDIYRLLDEVDHHIVKARERIRGRNFEKARNHLMAAISVKLTAVRGFPAADSASQAQGAPFAELYNVCADKDLLLASAVRGAAFAAEGYPLDPNAVALDGLPPLIQRAFDELKRLRDTHWPPPNPCADTINRILRRLRSLINAVRANPVDPARIRRIGDELEDAQRELLECLYPDSPVPMWHCFVSLSQVDRRLLDVYLALKY